MSSSLPQSNPQLHQQPQQGAIVPQQRSLQEQNNKNNNNNDDYESNSNGPAYTRPIIANLLPEYTNAHAEAIRQAFQPTSFRSLSSLSAAAASDLASASSSSGGPDGKQPFRVAKINTTFSDFEYNCSPFEAADELKAHQRKEGIAKMRKIAGDQEILAFRTAFPARNDKFDPIWDVPFLTEPYQSADDASMTRERLLKAATEKPFIPPGVQKSIGKPTRALLNDAMAHLFRCLAEDWPDAQPTVLTTAEDLIVIYFPLERIRNADGVTTYMSHALRRNEVIMEFDLRRVVEGWNVRTDDGFLLFTLRPPWVKARNFIKAAQAEEQAQQALMASFNSGGAIKNTPQK